MPTILRQDGFRFFFYSNEGNEPIHIHVKKGDGEGKVWLEPNIEVDYLLGFTPREQRKLLSIIDNNIETIRNSWNDYFN